jgi:hypothetical protein
LPTVSYPATKTQPVAERAARAVGAPVHVSSGFPSLPRTRDTVLSPEQGTQRSTPSDAGKTGVKPTVVSPMLAVALVVQNCFKAARGPPRFRTPSTLRDRNAAIWSRLTLPVGS